MLPLALFLGGLYLGGLSACSSDEPGEYAAQISGQLDKGMSFVEVGDTLAIDIDVLELDGAPVQFRWIWDTPESSQYELLTTVEIGRLSVLFTPKVPGRMLLSGRVEIDRGGDEIEVVGVNLGDVRAFGGQPVEALPAHAVLHLLVGERRGTFAFPMVEALGSRVLRGLGSGQPSYSVEDENIATVDESGHVTARTVGTTSLIMRYGDASTSIPVLVQDGELGDPALAPTSIDDDFAPIVQRAFTLKPTDGRMSIDKRGWPVMALVLDAVASQTEGQDADASVGGQVVLAEWTGSGWGLELVSRPYDLADEAQVVIDDNDVPYVLYSSMFVRSTDLHAQDSAEQRSFVLAGRTGQQSSWQHHALAHAQDADPARATLSGFGRARNLRAREGGGVWAAFVSSGTRYAEQDELHCVDQLQLAELNGSRLRMHEVAQREMPVPAESAGGCPDIEAGNASGADLMLDILPTSADQDLPAIVSSHPWNTDCAISDIACLLPVHRFDASAGVYTGKNLLLSFDFEAATGAGQYSYRHMAAMVDSGALDQPASILVELEASDAANELSRMIVIHEGSASWFERPRSDTSFGFRQDGFDYVGDSTLATMSVLGPNGPQAHGLEFSAPATRRTAASQPLQSTQGRVVAWAVSRDHLYLVQQGEQGLVLHASLTPRSLGVVE